jgi:hypothetical protein
MCFQNDFALEVHDKIIHWFIEELIGVVNIVVINWKIVCNKYC